MTTADKTASTERTEDLKQRSWLEVSRQLAEKDWPEGATDIYIGSKIMEKIAAFDILPSAWRDMEPEQRLDAVNARHSLLLNEAERLTIKKAFKKALEAKRLGADPGLVDIFDAFGLV